MENNDNRPYHMTTEEELEAIEFLCNGYSYKKTGKLMGRTDKSIKRVHDRNKKLISETKKQNLFNDRVNTIMTNTFSKKNGRMQKIDSIIDKEIDKMILESYDEFGNYIGAKKFGTLLNIYQREQKDLIDLTKVNDIKKKTNLQAKYKQQELILQLQALQNDADTNESTKQAIELLYDTLVKED